MGLCSHTFLTLCRTRGGTADVGYAGINLNASIRWTRSPPDLHHEHVLKMRSKWMRSRAYLVTRGGVGCVRSPSDGRKGREVFVDAWTHRDGPISIGRAKQVLCVDRGRRSWVRRGCMRDVGSSSEGSQGRKSWNVSWATILTISHDRMTQMAS